MSNSPDQKSNEENAPLTRRTFILAGAGVAAGACYAAAMGYPVYRYLADPSERAQSAVAVKEVFLKDADKLPVGTAMMFKFGVKPALLIRHAENEWTALTAVCTHLACTVQYDQNKKHIFCACHGGVYDAKTGANVSGPPPKPLAKFQVAPAQGGLTISLT